jgi:hypothetical protein
MDATSLALAVQVHEESTTDTAETIAESINAAGLGPAIIGSNGYARWTRTRTFSTIAEITQALIEVRAKFQYARAVDVQPGIRTSGAIVCSLGRVGNSADPDVPKLDPRERCERLRQYLEAFHGKQCANNPGEPRFDWATQSYWDEQHQVLTVIGPLTTICCLPLYDDVDYDEFIHNRENWRV